MTEIAAELGEAKMSGEAIFDHGTFGFALASILAPGLLGGALQGFDLDRHRASELVEKLESFIARDCKFFGLYATQTLLIKNIGQVPHALRFTLSSSLLWLRERVR